MKLLILLASLAAAILAEQVQYHNFTVHRVVPKTRVGLHILRDHSENNALGLDFWTEAKAVGHPVDIMVPYHQANKFNDLMNSKHFESRKMIHNVQDVINKERGQRRDLQKFGWTDYYTLDEINAWLEKLAQNDERVTLLKVGESYEKRQLVAVKVTFAPGNENRSVFLESNIHAREWISSAVNTWLLNELLTSTDPDVRQVADSHDWYVLPVANPDGFVYTHEKDRLWRKTRVPYQGCAGADPNRNWDFHYDEGGTSKNPCSEIYSGPKAFSEPEVKSLADFIATIGTNLQAYIAFHSYSQLMLIPYGHTSQHLDNFDDLYAVGKKAVKSLAKRYGTKFEPGNIVEIIYVASGGSMDWVKGTFQTPITYTFELRDTGYHGFVLPADQIIPSGEEILDALVTTFQEFDKILTK